MRTLKVTVQVRSYSASLLPLPWDVKSTVRGPKGNLNFPLNNIKQQAVAFKSKSKPIFRQLLFSHSELGTETLMVLAIHLSHSRPRTKLNL